MQTTVKYGKIYSKLKQVQIKFIQTVKVAGADFISVRAAYAELIKERKIFMTDEKITKTAKKGAVKSKDIEEYYKELVPVMLIKDNDRYKEDVTVTLNGLNYRIKRGVQVMVPRNVALILERGHKQEMDAQSFVDSLVKN